MSKAGKPRTTDNTAHSAAALVQCVTRLAPLAETSRELIKQTDLLYKLASRLIETCEREGNAKSGDTWNGRDITRARKAADEARQNLTKHDEGEPVHNWGQLRKIRYFWYQAHWLTERFPDAKLRDVEGLVKLVTRAEIEANDWSLTPGRYVGVAPEEEDADFDFEETLRDIHLELEELNAGAASLAGTNQQKFQGTGDMKLELKIKGRKNNFGTIYRHLVDYWQWFNNSGHSPVVIEEGVNQ